MPRLLRLAGVLALAAAAARCGSSTAPSCTYSVSPSSLSAPPAGGALTVSVSTSSSCAWTAASGAPWVLILNGAAGMGTGTVQVLVPPNLTGSRSGTITVAGRTIDVAQTAVPRFTLSGIVKEAWIDSGLGGVTVSVSSGPTPGTTTTDSRGAYSLNNLAAGAYRLSFSRPRLFDDCSDRHRVRRHVLLHDSERCHHAFPSRRRTLPAIGPAGGPYPNEPFRVAFIQDGNRLSGFYVDRRDFSESISGTINGRNMVFRVNVADGALLFECTVDDARNIRGVVKNERLGGNFPIVMTR